MVDEKESVSEWKVVSRSRSASLGDTHLTLLQVLSPLLSLLLFFGLVQSVLEATVSVLGRHSPHSSPGFFPPLPFSNTQVVTLLKIFFSLEFFCSSLSLSLARARSLSLFPPPSQFRNLSLALSLKHTPVYTHLHQVHPKHGRKHQAKILKSTHFMCRGC
jgi:hypothetical protein